MASWIRPALSFFLDKHQAQKVKSSTLERYQIVTQEFTRWALEQGYHPKEPQEWDMLLVTFKNEVPSLTRSRFLTLLSAVEFFLPHLKQRLHWSHAVIAGWTT